MINGHGLVSPLDDQNRSAPKSLADALVERQTFLITIHDLVTVDCNELSQILIPDIRWHLVPSIAYPAQNINIRSASGEKKTSGFADTPPEKARYFDGSAYDRMIKDLVQLAPLPIEGWAFKDDSAGVGTQQGYFKPEYDGKDLPMLRIDRFWDDQSYRGLAEGWYRRRWTCPDLPPGKRVFLHLGAVDESVWLYIDGRLAAWYDAADPGQTWDKPLLLEVSVDFQTARQHLLVFRVKNTAGAGGVWKPVSLMVEN